MLAGYRHFLETAASIQWDEAAVDLGGDLPAWTGLPPEEREALLRLIAGFCVGEAAVAAELDPFARAADRDPVSACFRAQAADEARHARFFDRAAAEVAGVPGATPAERREVLRSRLPGGFLELFEVRLPDTARRLAAGEERLEAAVALYHMVLEGVVFTAGQTAMLGLLRGSGKLPGVLRGVELVVRDERWHLGFGARCLQDAAISQEASERLVSEGRAAASAWGAVVTPDVAADVERLHRRRLRAAGMLAEEAVTA